MLEAVLQAIKDFPTVAFVVVAVLALVVGLLTVDFANKLLDRFADRREQRDRNDGFALGIGAATEARGYEAVRFRGGVVAPLQSQLLDASKPLPGWAHLRHGGVPVHEVRGSGARGRLLADRRDVEPRRT